MIISQKDGCLLRHAEARDMDAYLKSFFTMDPETAYFTQSKDAFSEEQVAAFFHKAVADPDRAFFLIAAPDGTILGESVINEIDWDSRNANFRIALFRRAAQGRGWAPGPRKPPGIMPLPS